MPSWKEGHKLKKQFRYFVVEDSEMPHIKYEAKQQRYPVQLNGMAETYVPPFMWQGA